MGILLAIIAAIIIIAMCNSFQPKGKRVERSVHNKLTHLPKEYFIMDDVVFVDNGHSTQIDHIVVSPYGVFVIETKGYKGWIMGAENAQYWTQNLFGRKYQFYNPILQNAGHIRFLKRLFREIGDVPMISIIVFENDADIRIRINDNIVVHMYYLLDAIKQFHNFLISDNLKRQIIETIQTNINTDGNVLNQHKFFVQETKQQSRNKIANGICPRCGGSLVQRHSQYGSFRGCSNYPRCKFTYKNY